MLDCYSEGEDMKGISIAWWRIGANNSGAEWEGRVGSYYVVISARTSLILRGRMAELGATSSYELALRRCVVLWADVRWPLALIWPSI
jgi:hypothetical protein